MNREIKFRAWNKRTGLMGSAAPLNEGLKFAGDNPDAMGELEHIVWMQYTGLHDKNGKEIYEGDLIKVAGYPAFTYEVKWLDKKAGFYLWNHYPQISDWSRDLSGSNKYEVIGNIWENGEPIINPHPKQPMNIYWGCIDDR